MLTKIFMVFLPVLFFTSTQLVAKPPTDNPPPIEIDAFIVNTPLPVEITNSATPDAPLPVVLAPEKIRQEKVGASQTPNTSGTIFIQDMFLVPVDKRAVIEHVSFRAKVPVGDKVISVSVGTPVSGVGVGTRDYLVPVFLGTDLGGFDVFTGSQQVRMYFEPGDEVMLSVSRDSTTAGEMNVSGYIHGYLIPISSP